MVNVLDSYSYADYMPRPRKDEPGSDGFPQRLSTLAQSTRPHTEALADMVALGITQMKRYEAGASQPTLDVIREALSGVARER